VAPASLPSGNYTGSQLVDNHNSPAGYSVDLGTFTAGTNVQFGIYVYNTQNTWFDGPGSLNAGGAVHAYTIDDFNYTITNSTFAPYIGETGSGTYVGFEDEAFPGGDFNYGDLQFVFSGVEGVGQPGQPPGVPDGGATVSMLGGALAGLGMLRRKFRK
jgi:hypothetical protein